MTDRRTFLCVVAGLSLYAAAGCGGGAALVITRGDVQAPGAARVLLNKQDDELFEFTVFNLSPEPMVVLRDNVRLATAAGLRQRLPGGITNTYTIPPGGSHQVNVKFPMAGLRHGEQVWVHFQEAISINGQPVQIEPVTFAVR